MVYLTGYESSVLDFLARLPKKKAREVRDELRETLSADVKILADEIVEENPEEQQPATAA